MARSRLFPRLIIIFVCAVLGASAGVCLQALRITGRPQEFRSLGKLVATKSTDGSMRGHDNSDLYGTIMETLETSEMNRRALDRVRALHPELQEIPVRIQTARSQGSGIINVLATGADPRYTRVFLDALLDEYMAFRQSMREMAAGKGLQDYLQAVVDAQKQMEDTFEVVEKARSKVDSPAARAEHERLVARLVSLRNQRDDLGLELKTAAEPDRVGLETKMSALEEEIKSVEKAVAVDEEAAAEFRLAAEKMTQAKATYEKMFARVQEYQVSITEGGDQVAIQERASPAAENVEDWKLPVAVGAVGGAVPGALFGLLLSLLILRSPRTLPLPA